MTSKVDEVSVAPRDFKLESGGVILDSAMVTKAPDGCGPLLAPKSLRAGKSADGVVVFDFRPEFNPDHRPVRSLQPTRWGGAKRVEALLPPGSVLKPNVRGARERETFQRESQVVRHGRRDRDARARDRMVERDGVRVKGEPVKVVGRAVVAVDLAGPVVHVAHKRMPEVAQVPPDLMPSTRLGHGKDQRAAIDGGPRDQGEVGDGGDARAAFAFRGWGDRSFPIPAGDPRTRASTACRLTRFERQREGRRRLSGTREDRAPLVPRSSRWTG